MSCIACVAFAVAQAPDLATAKKVAFETGTPDQKREALRFLATSGGAETLQELLHQLALENDPSVGESIEEAFLKLHKRMELESRSLDASPRKEVAYTRGYSKLGNWLYEIEHTTDRIPSAVRQSLLRQWVASLPEDRPPERDRVHIVEPPCGTVYEMPNPLQRLVPREPALAIRLLRDKGRAKLLLLRAVVSTCFESVRPELSSLARNESATIRSEVVRIISRRKVQEAYDSIVLAFEDSVADVRGQAALECLSINRDDARKLLTRLLNDPAEDVRYWAKRALSILQKA